MHGVDFTTQGLSLAIGRQMPCTEVMSRRSPADDESRRAVEDSGYRFNARKECRQGWNDVAKNDRCIGDARSRGVMTKNATAVVVEALTPHPPAVEIEMIAE